jgi:hypothetical protein
MTGRNSWARRAIAPALFVVTLVLVGIASEGSAYANRSFCAKLSYNYVDNVSYSAEDFLTGAPVWARFHYMRVKRDGTLLWEGYVTSGCTPSLSAPAGNYHIETHAKLKIQTPTGDALFTVRATKYDLPGYQGSHLGYLSSSIGGATTYHTFTLLESYMFNITAVLTRFWDVNVALKPALPVPGAQTGEYRIYGLQNCPGLISCFDPGTNELYLGYDATTYGWDYQSKAIIGHELGHMIGFRLFGRMKYWGYDGNGGSNQPHCRCDHVPDPINQFHCMGSREQFTDAVEEGWGHFFMAVLTNTHSETSASFPYYKHWLVAPPYNTVIPPPVVLSVLDGSKWMETHCLQTNRGVELDWMQYFYYTHTKTAAKLSFADFETVFKTACGGNRCNGQAPTWANLQTAANTSFGVNSPKANHFATSGDSRGVNH